MKWLLLVLLLAGCAREEDDAVMMCTLDGKAFVVSFEYTWRVRRASGIDHLCPKKSDQPKSVYKMRST